MVKHVMSYRDPENERMGSARTLGYAGLIPFWALVLFQFVEGRFTEAQEWSAEMVVVSYGTIIVSFMAGGRWVFRLLDPKPDPRLVLGGYAFAVMPPLLAWAILSAPDHLGSALFTPLTRGLLIGLILLFQLVQEYGHRTAIPPWYLDLRRNLTIGAVGGLWTACLAASVT